MAAVSRFRAHVSDTQLRRWRLSGMSIRRISELTGLPPQSIASRIHEIWSRASRESTREPPDEETIRRRCLEIQERWTDEERLQRAGHRRVEPTLTVVRVSDIVPGRR